MVSEQSTSSTFQFKWHRIELDAMEVREQSDWRRFFLELMKIKLGLLMVNNSEYESKSINDFKVTCIVLIDNVAS